MLKGIPPFLTLQCSSTVEMQTKYSGVIWREMVISRVFYSSDSFIVVVMETVTFMTFTMQIYFIY